MTSTFVPERQEKVLNLWVAPPYKDETVSSVIERAAVFHRIQPLNLYLSLIRTALFWGNMRDVDMEVYPEVSQAICKAMGLPTDDVRYWPSNLSTDCMKPHARHAYCPLCFYEDLRSGRTPHFRWQWAHAFVTLCHLHETPLFTWKTYKNTRWRGLPYEWVANPKTDSLELISDFARDLRTACGSFKDKERHNSPLSLIRDFQGKALVLERGPNECVRNRAYIKWDQLKDVIRDGSAWRDNGAKDPLASTLRPRGRNGIYFAEVPERDWRRLPKNSYLSFYRVRDVSWRRSVLLFAAKNYGKERTSH